jgi:hypothetical protein
VEEPHIDDFSGFPITPEMKAQAEMLKRKAVERAALLALVSASHIRYLICGYSLSMSSILAIKGA